MIRRALIPLDGSELAEQAIPHLLRFTAPERTEFLLMTALSSSPFPLFNNTVRRFKSERILVSNENEAGERVYVVAQQLSQAGFRVANQFLSGTPAESILHLAEEAFVDLIAMSTHGRTGLGLALLGSVADEVVRNARPPVFLVPAGAVVKSDPLPRTILLPLDGTPLAETAIPVTCQFAQNTGATVHLVRIVEPDDTDDGSKDKRIIIGPGYSGERPMIRQAISYLERIQLRLQLAGVSSRCQVEVGDPADIIARIVYAEDADLVVMSTHGRSGIKRMIHGSVVSQVISNTICPLLLMRGRVPVEVYEYDSSVVSSTSFC
jgi:nucleotide-binding universal stress UspA family protein